MKILKKIKKIEFSKLLLLWILMHIDLIMFATFLICIKTDDADPMEFLIGGIFGLGATAVGFYYWKAKAENCRKYGNVSLDDSDIDSGLSIDDDDNE